MNTVGNLRSGPERGHGLEYAGFSLFLCLVEFGMEKLPWSSVLYGKLDKASRVLGGRDFLSGLVQHSKVDR